METATFIRRREELEQYFDRTAAGAWAALTSDAPVSRIRETVRAGCTAMRNLILQRLPADLSGRRILDAGCGTGTLSMELASRGADIIGIDLSGALIELAQRRTPASLSHAIAYQTGDMTNPALGEFDHVIAMDSLIHYDSHDLVGAVSAWSRRTRHSLMFTFAPRTMPLAVMHSIGRYFPRSNRAPALTPIREHDLRVKLSGDPALEHWHSRRLERVISGFYTSELVELVRG